MGLLCVHFGAGVRVRMSESVSALELQGAVAGSLEGAAVRVVCALWSGLLVCMVPLQGAALRVMCALWSWCRCRMLLLRVGAGLLVPLQGVAARICEIFMAV